MYYPQSQITTDLYTNGDELIQPDGNYYTGYYYKTSDNRYFSGKNPNDTPNFELTLGDTESNLVEDAEAGALGAIASDTSFYLYPIEYKNNVNLDIPSIAPNKPIQIVSLPTEEDYNVSEFQRYFLTNVSSIEYIEVDKKQYDDYLNQNLNTLFLIYSPFTLPWLITGDRNEVYNINKKTVERLSKNLRLRGFNQYFKNQYDQFFRYQPGENLTTDGTEFKEEKTGQPYVGLYHIHPDKGPMVGAQHVKTKHDYLIPISGSNTQYRVNKVETQISNQTGSIGYSGGY